MSSRDFPFAPVMHICFELTLFNFFFSYLKFTLIRYILVFAICWMGSSDILFKTIITFILVIIMDYILNDSSAYCCLSEGFVEYKNKFL